MKQIFPDILGFVVWLSERHLISANPAKYPKLCAPCAFSWSFWLWITLRQVSESAKGVLHKLPFKCFCHKKRHGNCYLGYRGLEAPFNSRLDQKLDFAGTQRSPDSVPRTISTVPIRVLNWYLFWIGTPVRTIDTQMGSASSFFKCALYLVLKAHCSWYNVHPFWYQVRNISGTVRSVPSLSAVTFGSRQNLILGLNLEI